MFSLELYKKLVPPLSWMWLATSQRGQEEEPVFWLHQCKIRGCHLFLLDLSKYIFISRSQKCPQEGQGKAEQRGRKVEGFAEIHAAWRNPRAEPSPMTQVCSLCFVLKVSHKKKNILLLKAKMFLLSDFCMFHWSIAGLWRLLQCCWCLRCYPGISEILWSVFWFFSLLVIHMRNIRSLFSWRASGKIGKLYHEDSSSLCENLLLGKELFSHKHLSGRFKC